MKFVHLSDLHLGKRVNGYSMIEDQKYILLKILNVIDEQKAEAVVIAGDVYDKPIPPTEAVQLFDDFLFRLVERNLQILVISGNHDSPERIAFGSRFMDKSGVHMSQVYNGKNDLVELKDKYGKVNFYMLPFVKPSNVRRFFEDEEINTYTDAVRVAVSHMNVNKKARNVIITHQFVTGAQRSESETIAVGGTDNVDSYVFDDFDYVALGHIHGPQNVGKNTVRYCGTPLKYSFSEISHKKSVTVVEMKEKGNVKVSTVELTPKLDMREIKGTYEELTFKKNYENTNTEDYLHIILTDEEDVADAVAKLRCVYPNLMKLDYDNTRTRNSFALTQAEETEKKSDTELLSEFFEKQNGKPLSDEQLEYAANLFEQIKEEF
ncbi:MAG: exonuclease SbcCD subunit D [Ruminococcus sp.]|jgi:exonuclease SbcD|uniref:exonuclease SbcCD subunit D n=1 Tax=Ruminococcus sp. TaxID=41978 RepID=UPI0025D979A0|nr:exonuclease SbcCD subunit D [Ruminococcus sp.]MBD9048074.1 exonuclease SbcCD subunit D [Ruminococcus sp.]